MICMALSMDLLMESYFWIYLWNFISGFTYGFNLWIYMGSIYGFTWIYMDLHGFTWISPYTTTHIGFLFFFFCLCFFVLFCMRSIMSPDVSDDRGTCE